VALDAGLPESVPGQHLDRRCGSGLQAVINAVMQVQTGAHDVVVAGGTESMSNAASTGGRMLGTLARELHRREGRYGLETMRIGGGQGLATVFERVV
jgi:acetyl-CoA acetyltransferase